MCFARTGSGGVGVAVEPSGRQVGQPIGTVEAGTLKSHAEPGCIVFCSTMDWSCWLLGNPSPWAELGSSLIPFLANQSLARWNSAFPAFSYDTYSDPFGWLPGGRIPSPSCVVSDPFGARRREANKAKKRQMPQQRSTTNATTMPIRPPYVKEEEPT